MPSRSLRQRFRANSQTTLCIMCGDGAKGDVHRTMCGCTLFTPPGSALRFSHDDQDTDTFWRSTDAYVQVKSITNIQLIGHTNCGWAKLHGIGTPRNLEMINQTAKAMVERYQFGVDTWIVDDGHELSPKVQWGIGSFVFGVQRAQVIALSSYGAVSSQQAAA